MYDIMYKDAKRKKREVLPSKWTHLEFLVKLVYDLIFPEQTELHLAQLKEVVDDQTFTSTVRTPRFMSAFGTFMVDDDDMWDLSLEISITKYLTKVKAMHITKNQMEMNFFVCQLDGLCHSSLHFPSKSHCQYCSYQWNNELTNEQKESFL